jgi:hypothetical protein
LEVDAMSRERVLLIGRSRRVLDDAVAGLVALGYEAEGTNEFEAVPGRYDAGQIDLVVFGGAVPPDLKAELRDELARANPSLIFVDGLAGIPGLIVNQVRGAFGAAERVAKFRADDRSIRLSLEDSAHVKVALWWQTTFVPPDPGSDSLVVLEGHLPAGERAIAIPDHVPAQSSFATVELGAAVEAFSISTVG